MLPNSQRVNRGGMVLSELVEMCRGHDFTDIVILHEHRGEPGARPPPLRLLPLLPPPLLTGCMPRDTTCCATAAPVCHRQHVARLQHQRRRPPDAPP